MRPSPVSTFCELETVNALPLRVFRRDVTSEQANLSIKKFQAHLASRILERRQLPADAFGRALHLSHRRKAQSRLRSAELLHVAVALELHAAAFYSFQLQQRNLAEAEGLTLNPMS